MRYYISDLHFGHEALNDHMDNRGFKSAAEMNDFMINQWNSRVRKNDEVVILGDFSISRDGKEANEILKQLNGRKYLIIGNHDKFIDSKEFDTSQFGWIENYKELKDSKRKVILSHFPIMCYNGQYYKDERGRAKTYMLYGHVHNTFDELLINEFQEKARECKREILGTEELQNIPCQMINCFCMFSNYIPLTLDEWIKNDKKRRLAIKENS